MTAKTTAETSTPETAPTEAENAATAVDEQEAGTETPPQAPAGSTPDGAPETVEEPASTSEAIRYRRRLRETETERDALRVELDAARAELLAGAIARRALDLAPTALVEPGVIPAWDAVAGPDGHLDDAKITGHVRELRAARPHLFTVRPESAQGMTRGAPEPSGSSTWADAFKPDAFDQR